MIELICKRCKWKWDYKGKRKPNKKYPQYVVCPRCRTTVKLEVKGNEK
jgi:hypothetical protein